MKTLSLSYELTPEIVEKLRKINKLFLEATLLVKNYSEEERAGIHRYARISTIGASTRIENALLTDLEIDWVDTVLSGDEKTGAFSKFKPLLEDKLSKDRERSIEEVAGLRAVLHLVYEQGKTWVPLNESIIRGLHQLLLQYYPKAKPFLGKYKIQTNSVVEQNLQTGERRVVFETAPAGPITLAAMSNLITWYNETFLTNPWPLAQICEFVYRFLAIHPFQDGNGRLGRVLFLICLLQAPDETYSYLVPYLAIDRHIEQHKAEYYWVLNQCSEGKYSENPKKYKINYFLNFMMKILEEALKDIPFYAEKNRALNEFSQAIITVLDCFKDLPEIRLTTKIICEETHLPRRTVNYALNVLNEKRFIQQYGKGAGTRYQLIF